MPLKKSLLITAVAIVAASMPAYADGPRISGPAANAPAVGSAVAAYRAVATAYSAGETRKYFGGFAERMECFYGKRDYPRATLRTKRATLSGGDWQLKPGQLAIGELYIVSATSSAVVFVDYGLWIAGEAEYQMGIHQKIITMKKGPAGWKIAGEHGARHKKCPQHGVKASAPKWVGKCKRLIKRDGRACRKQCGGRGVHGCHMCHDEWATSAMECVGANR